VVPVSIATGSIGRSVVLDKDVDVGAMTLSPDGRELYVAGNHFDDPAAGDPILWTVG
jgi:hypothetical protein